MINKFKFYLDEKYQDKRGEKGDLELGYLDRESFFIAHFITRHLRSKKIKSSPKLGNIKQIILYFSSSENKVFVEYNDTLRCNLALNYSSVFELRGIERIKWFVNSLKIASNLLKDMEPKVGAEVEEALYIFEDSHYRNIWTHCKKRITGLGIAKLECELTPLHFFLTLIVSNKNEVIYKKIILTTPADSFMYHSLFNKMKVEKNKLLVLDRISERPIFEISIDEIKQNKEGRFPFNDMIENTTRFDQESRLLIYEIETNPKKTKWIDDFRKAYSDLNSNKPCPDLY